jgi:MFS family permease
VRTSWLGVSIALFVGVVAAGYVGKLPPALPALKAEFGLSLVAAGWVVSTFNTVALATAVAFGLAADRIGAFRFALAGLALLVVGGVGGAVAPSGTWLVVSRVVEGAGLLAVTVAVTASSSPRPYPVTGNSRSGSEHLLSVRHGDRNGGCPTR